MISNEIRSEILTQRPFFVVVVSHFAKIDANFLNEIGVLILPILRYNHFNFTACVTTQLLASGVTDVLPMTGHPTTVVVLTQGQRCDGALDLQDGRSKSGSYFASHIRAQIQIGGGA